MPRQRLHKRFDKEPLLFAVRGMRGNFDLTFHEHEELVTFLISECRLVFERYEPALATSTHGSLTVWMSFAVSLSG